MSKYGNEYKNRKSWKEVKDKEYNSDIYKGKSKEDNIFFPSLETPKIDKERFFTPDLKEETTNFNPSTEISEDFVNITFTPNLNFNIKNEERSFTPSLEMQESNERPFIPDCSLEIDKKPHENRIEYKEQLDRIRPKYLKDRDKNYFENTLFHPKLLSLFDDYFEKRNQKANKGVVLRPAFVDFIKTNQDLLDKDKEELLKCVKIINKERIIEMYIIDQLILTTKAASNIAKFENIKSIWIDHHYVLDKEKELGLEKRRVLRENVAHPNLIDNCFELINTKEKGYWLGVMYSDGSIYINKDTKSKKVTLKLNLKDKILIDKYVDFSGANKEKKEYIDNNVRIRISSKRMFDDLNSHGCIPNKSLKIEYPILPNREIELAFLLGYFDGDGTKGTSKITSGNRKFLEQIKEKFNIDNLVTRDNKNVNAYRLFLGVKLFNEILDNYEDSLPRKRIYLTPLEESIKRARKAAIAIKKSPILEQNRENLANIPKENIEEIIWEIPQNRIAKILGVLPKDIGKLCKLSRIDKPPMGYWRKNKYNPKLKRECEQKLKDWINN